MCVHWTDDNILIAILRCRKYSINNTLKNIEECLEFIHEHPELYFYRDDNWENVYKIIDNGCYIPLSKRDENGCKFLCFNPGKFNLDEFKPVDCMNGSLLTTFAIMIEEETQIAGVVLLIDTRDCSFHQIESLCSTYLMEITKIVALAPVRIKKIIIFGMPSFAVGVFTILKSFLSEKIKKRYFIVNSNEELWKIVDKPLLPEKFGGSQFEAENIRQTLEFVKENFQTVQRNLKFKLDVEKMRLSKGNSTEIGNFRKLEID